MDDVVFKIKRRTISLLEEELLDIQPQITEESSYLAITKSRKIIEINTKQGFINTEFSIDSEDLDFELDVSILISPNRNIIAVFNTCGRLGLVIDLLLKKIIMRFGRDDYYYEQTIFPVSFFRHDNQILLIHGTKWNRLDITNPLTGEVLTSRVDPEFKMINKEPVFSEHYLDYFHGHLLVSPNNEWVVDNGWEWHPVGFVTTWNIKKWITDNRWESEDGESKKTLWWGKEDWNDPMCWLSNTTVGISGKFDIGLYDEEDSLNLPKGFLFRIFDVCDGSMLGEFEICNGKLYFDTYLFCSSQDNGLQVYDISNGKVIFEEKTIKPWVYNRASKEFLEITNSGIIICKLIEEECNLS
ncbi:hypothetical protein E0485_05730 [Paenibacillus albiflavus]|uniref:Uncharacterized protein n=1 Tax=Paenibacillus albiflavus TaxID=2545760 RepID=A0A4R4EJC8_9BACL|nr:hypothetical protein [Paenibacillus albiflavus]TCZ79360.1 hypothetical protein E0485_05730 [Paenibacillus albiflavus]